jgi:hypothetical protein
LREKIHSFLNDLFPSQHHSDYQMECEQSAPKLAPVLPSPAILPSFVDLDLPIINKSSEPTRRFTASKRHLDTIPSSSSSSGGSTPTGSIVSVNSNTHSLKCKPKKVKPTSAPNTPPYSPLSSNLSTPMITPLHSRTSSPNRISTTEPSSVAPPNADKSGLTIATASEVIMELDSVLIHGDLPVNFAPFPESAFTHNLDMSVNKETFVTLAKDALHSYFQNESVVIQLVLDSISTPPAAHYSFSCVSSFLESNLPWLLSLEKPICIELYGSSVWSFKSIPWSNIFNWVKKYKIPLFVTVPKTISSDTQKVIKSVCSLSLTPIDHHFRIGLSPL